MAIVTDRIESSPSLPILQPTIPRRPRPSSQNVWEGGVGCLQAGRKLLVAPQPCISKWSWCMPVVSAVGRWMQENHSFKSFSATEWV